MVYKLCYIDGNKAWFTSNWKKQWGDDWGDRPYEHNAEEPYTTYFENGLEYIIPQKELYFELPYWCNVSRPCDGVTNSPYSVQDINNYRCPWLTITYNDETKYVFAGITYTKFIKEIEKLGGIVYLPKRRI